MGLMDFVGNAALTGNAMMGRQNEIDARGAEQERQARIQDELQAAREKTRMEMAQEFKIREEQRMRTQSADDGKAIQDDADKANRTRIADSINQKNGSSMTEEDARAIAANPEALKAYGLVGRYRAQELDDQIKAAQERGLDGKVKELRGQQDVEIARTREENRDANTNKRLDQQFEWQKTQAGIANRRADFAESNAKRRDEYMQARDEKADDASQRLAAAVALKDIAAQSKEISVAIAGGMLTPEALKLYESQKQTLDSERVRYQKQLGNMAGLPDAPKKTEPELINIGDVKDGHTFKGGDPTKAASWEKVAQPADKGSAKPAAATGPKEGDTRQVSNGRSAGFRTQVYTRSGPRGAYAWTEQ